MTRYTSAQLKGYIRDNVFDVADLVLLLEIDIEDILDVFPHKLLEHQDKFGITGYLPEDIEDDDPYRLEEQDVQETED